ncbi:MAG: T9SS type A sorting domain-containing protein, partial [Paludibacteraceae bacterium]|nr:T9SS type A sorting domain-containing protein [Paludibacteraceae bacterium]
TVVVVRIDYSQLKELNEHQLADSVFYQIVDVTTVDSVIVKLKDANGNPTYHHDGTSKNEEYGSIAIPKEVKDDLKKENVDVFVTELTTNNTATSGKCFVQDHITEKWFLYLVQIIPNGDEGDRDKYLDRDRQYILRVAYNAKELHKAACVFTSPLLAKQDTYLELRNEKVGTMRVTSCLDNLCANNHHFLDVKVSNAISASAGGAMQTYEALVHADWLRGFEEDDVCCEGTTLSEEEQNAANTAFFNHYGYTRSEIKHAIVSMRQKDGKNYTVSNADDLQVDGDFGEKERAMIRDLCNKGLLKLYQQSMMFYLGSAASARYWVYPVAEDAIVIVNGTPVPLQDCDEPLWVKVTSEESEYGVNLSPKDYEDLTEHQRLDIPTIRVIEGTENVTIPVKELIESTRINTELSTDKESIKFNVHNPKNQVLEYIDLSNNQIEIQDAPTSFEVGKEYLMRMAFYDENGYAFIGGDTTQCRVGYVYFYLMFAPKENTWTGAKSAIWGDDRNWSGGCAPLPETDVIIPVMPEDKPYPIVTKEDKYPLDVNYKSYTCNDIYFAPGAMIHNQHLLQYNKAFVDMKIEAANWNSMAPPLKGMYTGDMYVPHNGMYDGTTDGKNAEYNNVEDHSDYPFVVNSFQGTRTSKAPYVFWQSLYNKRATIYHENGNQSHPALTTTAIFAQTNSLGQPLPPGTGYQVLGFGPQRNESDDIIVRLPKPDTYYSYYYSNGTVSDQRAYVEHSSKLAFEPDANGDMYITLTNDLSSNQFMFGNPAMTNIDMKKFLEDPYNAQLAKKYYTMSESSWKAENWFTMEHPGSGELAPMRSVLLELVSGEAKSITIKLSKTHLVGYTEPVPAGVVARKYIVEEESGETQLMTIYATCENGQARCVLASNAYAHDMYNGNEDALFISSGVENGVNSATATSPVNMYTVAQQVPMMVDVRENIDTVPVSMLVHDSYRTEKVRFSFYLSLNWEKECYFCDAVTGARYRILDGLWLEMDMPLNHATRYFITGPDQTTNSGVVTNTTNPNVAPLQVWAYSEQAGEITVRSNDIIQSVTVYDMTGRLIAHKALDLLYNQVSLPVGQGVHIAEVTLRDNSKHYTRTIVK